MPLTSLITDIVELTMEETLMNMIGGKRLRYCAPKQVKQISRVQDVLEEKKYTTGK